MIIIDVLLRFIYVIKHEELDIRVRDDLPYIQSMGSFFRWWLNKNFGLRFDVLVDILAVEYSPLRRLRFGLSDLITHHRNKGKDDYHVYLAYFKPLISDCSVGYFTDNFGLVQWTDYRVRVADDVRHGKERVGNEDDGRDRIRFFAIENCTKVSHIILHEVGRRRGVGKRYNDAIHDTWIKHLSRVKEFELYDNDYRSTKYEDYSFATMSIPVI